MNEVIKKSSIKTNTLNPGFFETIKMDIRIPEFGENGFPSGMSVLCYDDDISKN